MAFAFSGLFILSGVADRCLSSQHKTTKPVPVPPLVNVLCPVFEGKSSTVAVATSTEYEDECFLSQVLQKDVAVRRMLRRDQVKNYKTQIHFHLPSYDEKHVHLTPCYIEK